MPEPEIHDEGHVERKVVVETVSSSSTRNSGLTIGLVVVIALAIIIWVVVQMR
jgi:hypothetical protein